MVAEEPIGRTAPVVVDGPAALDALAAELDALALFVFEDERPLQGVAATVDWRLCGALSRALERHDFTGKAGEVVLVPGTGRLRSVRLFVFGLGARDGVGRGERWGAELRTVEQVMRRAGASRPGFAAPATWRDGAARDLSDFVGVATSGAQLEGRVIAVVSA